MNKPINFQKFIRENEHKLQPPVNNILLQKGEDYIVMAIGGPNERSDYHINETEEWFYQYRGDMILKIVKEEKEFIDIPILEGEMFLLPKNVPHCPVRFRDTIGLVLEKNRGPYDVDKMRWYCQKCKTIINEMEFNCQDIVTQIKTNLEIYNKDAGKRECKHCGNKN